MLRAFMFCISCICSSIRLEYNSLFVGLGFWGGSGNERKI